MPCFETLRLKNFRSFKDHSICFSPDLTILVGENWRKDNAIDALRLITSPLSHAGIFLSRHDIRFGSPEPKHTILATIPSLRRDFDPFLWQFSIAPWVSGMREESPAHTQCLRSH